jgi:hypothetical protein
MKMEILDREMMVFTPGIVTKEKAWKIVGYLQALCVEL